MTDGRELYGDPAYANDAAVGKMRCGQAVVKDVAEIYDPDVRLGDL